MRGDVKNAGGSGSTVKTGCGQKGVPGGVAGKLTVEGLRRAEMVLKGMSIKPRDEEICVNGIWYKIR